MNKTTGNVYTPHATRSYEDAVAWMVMAQGEKYGSAPIRMEAMFYCAKEKPGDIDNLVKSISDGAQKGGAFDDDSQIVMLQAVRFKSDNPRVEVVIEPTEDLIECQE